MLISAAGKVRAVAGRVMSAWADAEPTTREQSVMRFRTLEMVVTAFSVTMRTPMRKPRLSARIPSFLSEPQNLGSGSNGSPEVLVAVEVDLIWSAHFVSDDRVVVLRTGSINATFASSRCGRECSVRQFTVQCKLPARWHHTARDRAGCDTLEYVASLPMARQSEHQPDRAAGHPTCR